MLELELELRDSPRDRQSCPLYACVWRIPVQEKMSKSTLESLEKLLAKYVAPLEQKLDCVLQEVKILREKVEKFETKPATSKDKMQVDTAKSTNARDTASSHTSTSLTQAAPGQKRRVHAHETTGSIATPPSAASYARPARVQERASPQSPAPAATALSNAPQSVTTTHALATNNSNDDEGWKEVSNARTRKRSLRKRTVVKGSGTADVDLKTVERTRKLHVCFFAPSTTADSILSYMKKKKQCDSYSVEKLKLAHNHYSSFAVSVPSSHFEFFMSAQNWPVSTEISEWFRRSGGRAGGAPRRQQRARIGAAAADSATATAEQPLTA